jgi:nitronate monooxygenase
MWPDRRLCDLLGIEHPIIQAPMAGSATPALAAAVANAGGLGSLGCGTMRADEVRDAAGRVRAVTNRPFNLNFFVHPQPSSEAAVAARMIERLQPYYDAIGAAPPPATLPELPAGFDHEKLELLLELVPPVVSFHFGLPDVAAIAALKRAGIVLLSSATTVAEARRLAAAGIDAVIAQGYEAGGHRGSHRPTRAADGIGLLALVPQIADAVDLPVIAAGGIGDGRGIAAAFALGASGVQLGTAFLSCPEAATEPSRRAAIAAATDEDTMVTEAISGSAARARRSRYALAMAGSAEKLPDFPQLYELTRPLVAAHADDLDGAVGFHLYGPAAALNRELPAADLVARLVAETATVLAASARALRG